MAKYYGGVAPGPTFWDYISYSPDNPLLRPISEFGRTTGFQQGVTKKALTIAGQAGTGFRQTLGYGEAYNISQEQAGEIGYFFGSLVTPGSMVVKAGSELVKVGRTGYALPGLLTVPGKFKKAEEVGGLIKATERMYKGKKIAEEAGLGAKVAGEGGFWAKVAGKTPSLGTMAKVGAGAGIGYLGYQAFSGAGGAIERGFSGLFPTKKDQAIDKDGGNGGDGVSPVINYIIPEDWKTIWGPPGEDFFSKLGNLFSAPGIGFGSGLEAIGAGTGANIVPLAIVIGGAYLATQYMGKRKTRKDKGKKR